MKHIPVARPTLGEEEAAAARRAILSGWVIQGPEVEAFEQEFAAAVGAAQAVACSSGTAALHLALKALDIGPGDEVITVSHSFIATANAVRYVGATPVFVDVEYLTGNIDPELIAPAITPRTKALLVAHQLGMPCDLERILPLARAHRLRVVEDAACATGSEIRFMADQVEDFGIEATEHPQQEAESTNRKQKTENRKLSRWEPIGRPRGDLATFSFHPRKIITTGDGGMVTGSDPEIMARMARLRTHAMSLSTQERDRAGKVVFEQYPEVGFNYRLSDIQGAVGREQLKRLPQLIEAHRLVAARYREALTGRPFIDLPVEPPYARSNWQSFWIIISPECPLDQAGVMQALLAKGIHTRRGVMCAHREPAYGDLPLPHPLPVSEVLQDRSIILPMFPSMTDGQQDRVVSGLLEILK